jgi:prepilin-type N-terminal cleavage/methylation domain-containing protein
VRLYPGHIRARGFTLIELIAVMTVLIITVSMAAPALSNFFRGRSLNSEARRMLALTHRAQSRAISEGIPMDLWIDAEKQIVGISAEASYEPEDSKAEEVALENGITIEAISVSAASADALNAPQIVANSPSTAPILKAHPELPAIRFLADGSVSETSPEIVRLTGVTGESLWLAITPSRMSYEIRTQSE